MIQDAKENSVLSAVDKIFQKGHKSKFSETYIQSLKKEAEIVSKYLNIESEPQQSLLWGMLLGMGVQSNSSIDIDTLSQYLNVPVLQAFQLSKSLEFLSKRKLLQKQKGSRRRRGVECLQYLNFFVPGDIVQAVVNGEPLPPRRSIDMDIYQLLDLVLELFQQRDDGYFDTDELGSEIQEVLEENKKLPFVRQVLSFKLPVIEQIILLMVCQQFVQGYQSVDLVRLLKTLFIETQKQLHQRKEWINSKTKLQQLNLVDLESEADFRNDKAILLTPKGQELFGNDRSLLIEHDVPKNKNIILSSSIIEKRLYFNERERNSLEKLNEMLQVDNHRMLVNRMKELGHSSGLTILFHGSPGTGKTEMVNQLAKSTFLSGCGRDIFKIDISEMKSKWWGESEKRTKAVFDYYRKLLTTYEIAPILLFNEMDGVFGKRIESSDSNTTSTSNAIQSVLLNEMEQFPLEGILIATTNLPKNLDKAFERRFLQKIYFEKPDSLTRSFIWKDNLPLLEENDVKYLSDKFPFSGGQISNIVKKTQIEIIMGRNPDLKTIEEFCVEETLDKPVEKRRIGYLA